MRRAVAEGNRVAENIKKNGMTWNVAEVDLNDDRLSVLACAQVIRRSLNKVGFLLISAGIKKLIIVLDIPESLYSEINGLEFFEKSLQKIDAIKVIKRDESVLNYYCIRCVMHITNPSPLKAIVQSSATDYLQTKGLIKK